MNIIYLISIVLAIAACNVETPPPPKPTLPPTPKLLIPQPQEIPVIETTIPQNVVWENTTENGYPAVFGSYEFNTSKIGFLCSDGGEGSINKIESTALVEQNGKSLTIRIGNNPFTNDSLGKITVLGSSVDLILGGEVAFFSSRILTVIDQDKESHKRIYSIEGKFKNNSWSGLLSIKDMVFERGLTCDYSTEFHGNKL